ncbi:DUF1295 domain-containing protein [Luteipulveratus mongoliensis]|uniref:Membrane protein n=1 Tax=Luteipulveratus mongoliensis TaxID=571913 RepID=A0A0K1JL39_9MICO|nr:DUF1295 domain-containing protein [Luteipulveratus mongoliensis]AKU17285.1 membrane protein [Luteipulveratus mongoliensis]
MRDFLTLTLVCVALLAVVQGTTFWIGHRIGRYNVVDVAWGLGLAAVAVVAAIVGDGDGLRRVLLLLVVGFWGLRLSWHIWRRSRGGGEDPRYAQLLDGAGTGAVLRKVFVTQGVAQWFISLPIQVSAVTGPPRGVGRAVMVLGVVTAVGGVMVESVADRQLAAFKADPGRRGQVMDSGLWGWSRHPNYFGDACVWIGIYLIAAAVWPGVLTVLSPAAMVWFLVVATGARLLERHLAERPGYREYQARTSFFVLRPPRRDSAP